MTNYVKVRFKAGVNEYIYLTNLKLEVGDVLVVEVNDEYKCVTAVKVKGFTVNEINRANKWVVQKVNTEEYEILKEKGALMLEIKAKLRARKEAAEERIIYETLAKDDPEIKKLLETYDALHKQLLPEVTT